MGRERQRKRKILERERERERKRVRVNIERVNREGWRFKELEFAFERGLEKGGERERSQKERDPDI